MDRSKIALAMCHSVTALFLGMVLASCGGYTGPTPASTLSVVPASGIDPGTCVQDSVTGLMWEVKTVGGLRDWNKTYTNYDSTLLVQKADGTVPTPGEINAQTNSIGFKNSVNAQGMCGFSDWRLPAFDELQSIVVLNGYIPTIDTAWFPNTLASAYWTASPFAGSSISAGSVDFRLGSVNFFNRSSSFPVRLVRSTQ